MTFSPKDGEARPSRYGAAVAGAVLLFGLYVVWEGSSYPMGTLSRTGPGYLPVVLGCAASVIGAVLLLRELRAPDPVPAYRLRPSLFVIAAIFAFALLIDRAGLIVATFALVIIASAVEDRPWLGGALVLATVLSTLGALIFVIGLGMPVDVFPAVLRVPL